MFDRENLFKRFAAFSVLAIALVALAVAGCGDDDAGGDTTSPLTKAAYVKKVNQICFDSEARIGRKIESFLKETGKEIGEGGKATGQIGIREIENRMDEIQELGAPRGDQGQTEALLVAMQQGIDRAEEQVVDTPAELTLRFVKFDKLAQQYGLDSCTLSF
jgi:hypothetical protein